MTYSIKKIEVLSHKPRMSWRVIDDATKEEVHDADSEAAAKSHIELLKRRPSVTLDLPVSLEWLEFALKYQDLFMTNYSGYWACCAAGVEKKTDDETFGGWLVFDCVDADRAPSDEEIEAAEAAHEAGEKLPENFLLLDEAAACRAFSAGVKRWGVQWYEDGDASTYDYVLQMALLGEVLYG
jgi:hypothetical protein